MIPSPLIWFNPETLLSHGPIMKVWAYAVATWRQGRLAILSEWYVSKFAARCEYDEMGKSFCMTVIEGKAFIYRHLVPRRLAPMQGARIHRPSIIDGMLTYPASPTSPSEDSSYIQPHSLLHPATPIHPATPTSATPTSPSQIVIDLTEDDDDH